MYHVFIPKSKVLRTYIADFAILKKENFKPIRYLAFPYDDSSVTFFSEATITYKNDNILLEKTPFAPPFVTVLGKYLTPLHLSYKNAIDEINVNFTATGLNYFFDQNLGQIGSKPFQLLNNEIWTNFSKKLYSHNEKERINLLEDFLLSQLKKKDLKIIEQIVKIFKNNLSVKIKDIAQTMQLSERTINRLFHSYIGCTPTAYKKILRFRKAVAMKNKKNSLTEVSLLSEYYDSAHFTHEFQQLTSTNPTSFFNKLTKVNNNEFPFIFK